MHDARPTHAVDDRQRSEFCEQRVDERAVGRAARWMGRHPRRLVNDAKLRLIVNDPDGQILRNRARVAHRRRSHADAVAEREGVRRFGGQPVDQHAAGLHELGARAPRTFQMPGEGDIEPAACVIRGRAELLRFAHSSAMALRAERSCIATLAGACSRIRSWMSVCVSSSTTPTVIAESAVLNTGHARKSMKSWT